MLHEQTVTKLQGMKLFGMLEALEAHGWNQTRAAALLGLNRDQIRYRIEKFHLERANAQ